MKHTLLFATIASFVAVHAYANNIVTSKTYVDGRDALKVDIAQGTGDNNANVGKTLVVNSSGNLELGTPAAGNYVEDAITDGVTDKAPSENAVHDALENKQDMITTAEVDMNGYDLPALVSYDTTNGLVGNKIGILDQETIADDEGDLSVYNDLNYPDGEMDNYVPTVRAVADGLSNLWVSMPKGLNWSSSLQTPINNYSTTFSSASNTWPNNQQNYVPTAQTLANGLALKQNKIPARQTKIRNDDELYAPSVVTTGTTDGAIGQMAIVTNEYILDMGDAGTEFEDYSDNVIPTAAAVSTELKIKQRKLGGTSAQAGKVVTATATEGNVTYTAIDGTVTNASNNLVTSGAVYTAVNAKQDKKTCAGWLDGTTVPDATHTDANCVLWNLPD